MKTTLSELEKAVLKDFLVQNNLEYDFFGKDFEDINVTERRIEGSGYITELTTQKILPIGDVGNGGRWLRTIGTINSGINVGFTVYVDKGKINAVEGFTLGERWPDEITNFTIKNDGENHA